MAFSHLDTEGNVKMADVSEKKATFRTAKAQATVILPPEVLSNFENGDIQTKKGAVFQIARIAGIMAAKRTGELIPLCHTLGLENCDIKIDLDTEGVVKIVCLATVTAKTGVEMEALTGATVAALTVYDMCKVFSQKIEIRSVVLLEKTGGKTDYKL